MIYSGNIHQVLATAMLSRGVFIFNEDHQAAHIIETAREIAAGFDVKHIVRKVSPYRILEENRAH